MSGNQKKYGVTQLIKEFPNKQAWCGALSEVIAPPPVEPPLHGDGQLK